MAFLKSSSPGGKKQVPMPGPNSAAYKKIAAAKKSAASGSTAHGAAGKASPHKGNKKGAHSGGAFTSLKSKQMLVERIKRAIWSSVMEINEAIITLAKAGNLYAAKALFDFAGVYALPPEADGNAAAAPLPSPAAEPACANLVPNPVDAFFQSIGLSSAPQVEPEPRLAG
ncbi:MAG TPA: hypothetical protein VLV47_00325 [Candidatus Bathyarchaeia archaeon]|nr:hypothetical protein [Candidatus Bathyarchaeia archaeon]